MAWCEGMAQGRPVKRSAQSIGCVTPWAIWTVCCTTIQIFSKTWTKFKLMQSRGEVQCEWSQWHASTVVIPVVFHVLYNTPSENISEAQNLSQLDILNQDFRRFNQNQDSTWPQAADTQIEFCIAVRDQRAPPTALFVYTDVTLFGPNDAMKFSS